jgi:2-methylcitrate dehydratase PrpD
VSSPPGAPGAYLDTLAGFAAALDLATVPAAVSARARWIVLDTLGAIVGAAPVPEIDALGRWAAERQGPVRASLLGQGRWTTPELAALVNGTAANRLELDEGNHRTLGHVAIHVVPAALAVAEAAGAGGADLLTAVLAGYEVGARLARLGPLRPGMHPHGTWGTMAAAVAAARLAGGGAAAIRRALDVAASMALVTSRRTIAEGAGVKYLYTGVAGQLGVQAVEFAAAGFTGEPDGPGSLFATIAESARPGAEVVDDLGRAWEVAHAYFKVHACCRYATPAVDAALALRDRGMPGADEVVDIRVTTFDRAARLHALPGGDELSARFSLPYCVAAAAVRGDCGLGAFAPGALADPRIGRLAARVRTVEDPAMTARFPDATPARVAMTLLDGTVREAAVEHALGDPGRPLPEGVLRAKFAALAGRVLTARAAAEAAALVLGLDEVGALDELAARLRADVEPARSGADAGEEATGRWPR